MSRAVLIFAALIFGDLAIGNRGAAALPYQKEAPVAAEIPWAHGSLDAVLEGGTGDAPLVLVYFWMEGSAFCSKLYGETLQQQRTVDAFADLVCFSADVGSETGGELLGRFGVTTLPTMLFLSPAGEPEDAILGHITVESLLGELQRIRDGQNTVGDLRARAVAAPTDLALRFKLARKLFDVGASAEGKELIESIKRDDPKGETEVCARIRLSEERDAVAARASAPDDVTTWKLEPLYRHVKGIRPKSVAYDGWTLLAELELSRGDTKAAFGAWREAREYVDATRLAAWGLRVVDVAWDVRDDLAARDRRLAVDAAQAVTDEFRANPPQSATPPDPDEDPIDLAAALEALARAQHVNGRRAKAIEAIDEAIELAPERTNYRDRKAELEQR